MPDDDRIPRYLTGPWRKVLRCRQGRESAERAADAVTSALAATLRSVHGVPNLPDIAARMQEAATGGPVAQSRVPASEAARRHVPTDVAERAAASFAVTMREELALVSPAQAALMLARRVVTGLAYQYGLDRIGPVLAAEGAYNTNELQALFTEILASDQVSKLAQRLLPRPSATGLRAPLGGVCGGRLKTLSTSVLRSCYGREPFSGLHRSVFRGGGRDFAAAPARIRGCA